MKNVERTKALYKKGKRVKLINMNDPYGVPSGTKGTIRFVDDMGTIHVNWDNGSTLGLIVGQDIFNLED